ncbi:16S rRNA (guanine(966)-N(2))-methyltransferase RsmD [Candidatus Saccharibacteria bacterium]|nr:16S rRNA (guanine(966)-N(2))-methyltransferase RsmD [Candidatus Saccharibacteria bacterium]
MNIRIIAGRFGGRTIEGSGTERTHPMGERIRNALFNTISAELEGAVVLDAFAGSGALGLEALSRGASQATFVERDRVAQQIITNNIKLLGVGESAKLARAPVAGWAETTKEHFDIIFADPPYHDMQLSTVKKLTKLLKPNGLMVLSYPGRGEVPTELGVVVVDNRSYGDAALAFYRKEDA